MAWLIDQILTLLASNAGNLAYHLVLVFSIAGALQMAINQSTRVSSGLNKRLILGLGVLLFFQIALFIASGLVWQGVLKGYAWLPVLARIADLLSLVVIAWLWAFPHANPAADAATVIIGLLAVIGSTFGVLWWIRQDIQASLAGTAINGSEIDLWLLFASLGVIGLGLLVLSLNRPTYWGYGVSMLLILAAGYAAHLFTLSYGGDYPTVLRLFQMAAYPFLLILPQRLLFEEGLKYKSGQKEAGGVETTQGRDEDASIETVEKTADSIDLQILKALLEMENSLDENQARRRIVSVLTTASHSDSAFLIAPPNADNNLQFLCGFDNNTRRYFDSTSIEATALPILVSCLRMGRVRRLAASSTSPDRMSIAKLYGLEQIGAMLFVPVLSPEGNPLNAVILVAMNSANDWSPDEQSTLGMLAKLLVRFMRRGQESQALQTEMEQARQAARRVQDQAQQVLEEDQKLRDKIAVLQENASQRQEQLRQMSILIGDQAILHSKIAALEEERKLLDEKIARVQRGNESQREQLEGELRLSLEELSLLREMVEELETRLAQIKSAPDETQAQASDTQLSSIISISQDLRQPLASIVGYTDVLLGESVGILGANQRRYLERIKLSTERFDRLLEELVQVSMVESDPSRIQRQEIDVRSVIQEALQETHNLIQLRNVALRTELPEQPITIQTDQNALRKVIVQLLRNAGMATPEGGDVCVAARVENGNNEKEYVLLQVTDSGYGISAQDLPRVFSPRLAESQIQGLGNGKLDLVRMKSLVEALGGRTWVDSEPGAGSVFSLLLPSARDQEGEEMV